MASCLSSSRSRSISSFVFLTVVSGAPRNPEGAANALLTSIGVFVFSASVSSVISSASFVFVSFVVSGVLADVVSGAVRNASSPMFIVGLD